MKHATLHIILTTLLIMLSSNILALPDTKIYLENYYGTPIKYKIGTSKSTAREVNVNNQARVWIGTTDTVKALSIRTTGIGSSLVSYFTELTEQLVQINQEKLEQKNNNKDAVIIIKPSRSYQNWDIEINWQAPGQEVTALPADLSIEHELAMIMDGSLGNDYAQKTKDLYDYDYTKATKGGFINLRNALMKKIEETMIQTYKKSPGKKGTWITPGLATTQEVKDTIDSLHRALQKYKIRDFQ